MVSLGFIGLTVFLLSGSCSPSTLQGQCPALELRQPHFVSVFLCRSDLCEEADCQFGRPLKRVPGSTHCQASFCSLYSPCPPVCAALQASSVVVLALGGRVPQIVLNIQRGNSGELSILSTGLSLLGNFARVITTMVLVKDVLILSSSISQAVLNAILLWQCLQTRWRAQNKLQFQSSAL